MAYACFCEPTLRAWSVPVYSKDHAASRLSRSGPRGRTLHISRKGTWATSPMKLETQGGQMFREGVARLTGNGVSTLGSARHFFHGRSYLPSLPSQKSDHVALIRLQHSSVGEYQEVVCLCFRLVMKGTRNSRLIPFHRLRTKSRVWVTLRLRAVNTVRGGHEGRPRT